MPRRLLPPLVALASLLALAPFALALDAAELAPALEASFPPTLTYVDCPFAHAARTCVLLPGAPDRRSALRRVLAALAGGSGVHGVREDPAAHATTFIDGTTAYRLSVAPSRTQPAALAATLSYTFAGGAAYRAACLRTEALFALARQASLSPRGYDALSSAIACHGADPLDSVGRTPLSIAAASGNLAAVQALLRGGADPNHIDHAGWTPLLVAARGAPATVVDALLRSGADPSYVAPDGSTIATLEPFNRQLQHLRRATLSLPGVRTPLLPLTGIAGRAATGPAGSAPGPAEPPAATKARARARQAAPAVAPPSRRSAGPADGALPLELLALLTVAGLAAARARNAAARARDAAATTTRVGLPAMPPPSPYRRQRRTRHLAAAPPDDTRF